jgi:hypothetical protein
VKTNDQINTAATALAAAPNTTIESLKALLKDKSEKAVEAKKAFDNPTDPTKINALRSDAQDASDELLIVELALELFEAVSAKNKAANKKIDRLIAAKRETLKANGFLVHETAVTSVPYYEKASERKPSLLTRVAAIF